MKKAVALVAVAALAASAFSGTAIAGKKKKVRQEVSGHIISQAPPSDNTDNPAGCFSGVHRRIAVLSQEQVNGVVGFHFDVDRKTWGKKFRLANTTPDVDIDITFYSEFGTLEQAADKDYAPFATSFEERNTKGEFGKVPADMTKAIVCMKTGQQADFTYVAGSGVKK